jgi:hypothetical protein
VSCLRKFVKYVFILILKSSQRRQDSYVSSVVTEDVHGSNPGRMFIFFSSTPCPEWLF